MLYIYLLVKEGPREDWFRQSDYPRYIKNLLTYLHTYLLVIHYRLFQGGSFVVVLCCRFNVRVSVTFYVICVHIIFSSVRLLSGHLLGNSSL